MRIHGWDDRSEVLFKPPPHMVKEGGTVLEFHDYPQMYDMQPGDIIQYRTGLGVTQFVVSEVRPAELPDYPPELTLVTARKKES